MPDFKEFWAGLEKLSRVDPGFKGCRGGCGDPGCRIRQCARSRKIEIYPACEDYPCRHIQELAKRYPNLIGDGRRQQEVGLEQWIEEQEARCENGFCYCDIRYEP